MIKTIIKAMYSAFISIVLLSIVLAGWTSYTFISQSSKSVEIIKVVQDMYSSQKSVFIDLIDLTKILIKDTNEINTEEINNLSVETELLTDVKDKSQLDEALITDDNPLGIIIEPSIPELGDNTLPEIIEDPLVNENNELSLNQISMDMNS